MDANEQPVARVELPAPAGAPLFRVAAPGAGGAGWEPDRTFSAVYQFGRKRYDCQVSRRAPGAAPPPP